MEGQAGLNRLNGSIRLTPPSELIAQAQVNQPQEQKEEVQLPQVDESQPALQSSDNQNISNIASAAAGGVMGISSVVKDLGTIGESMRSVDVQNSMIEMQSRSNTRSSYRDYEADYGAAEFLRRRGNGRIEYNSDNRYGRIESNGITGPETRMAATNIAKGTFQGAKYGFLIGGAVSSVVNAYKVLTGKEKGAGAVGAVAADTLTAGISGAGGALAGGLATLGLASIGVAGPVGMAVAVGVGAFGAVGSQMLMTKTGIYDSIKQKVAGMLSK